MENKKEGTYEVIEFTLGQKDKREEIVFKSEADMEDAYRQIDLGKDIRIIIDGKVTLLPSRTLTNKVYDGTLIFRAIPAKGGK